VSVVQSAIRLLPAVLVFVSTTSHTRKYNSHLDDGRWANFGNVQSLGIVVDAGTWRVDVIM